MHEAPDDPTTSDPRPAHAALGLAVIERGWLSANQAVFPAHAETSAAVVDTGFLGHAEQTVALVDEALRGAPLGRIVNTHLHSDHCGGNAALQGRAGVQTWIPAASIDAVAHWNARRLSFEYTGQPCTPFRADHALVPGASIRLGAADWQVHAAPGHDNDAVMLFEPQTRTLIAGDALWEERLAIIFPELVGDDGFGPARATLDLIERLAPHSVIPGHGAPFDDAPLAVARSRERLAAFERSPERHARHASRALLVFHLLDVRTAAEDALVAWMLATPVHRDIARRLGIDDAQRSRWALSLVRGLVDDGVLQAHGGRVGVRPQAR